MSTSCLIGIKLEDRIESIYCHWDGYPRGVNSVGAILKQHYSDETKIKQLMDLGDLSSLGYEPVADEQGWDLAYGAFEYDHSKCVAYRTRGDDDIEKHICASEDEYVNTTCGHDVNFIYIYKEGKWQVFSVKSWSFKPF